jgi:hypothetical protein
LTTCLHNLFHHRSYTQNSCVYSLLQYRW